MSSYMKRQRGLGEHEGWGRAHGSERLFLGVGGGELGKRGCVEGGAISALGAMLRSLGLWM